MRSSDSKTPKEIGQTEKILLTFSTDLKKRVIKESEKMFGQRKGAVSLYVEQAMRIHLHMNIPGVEER